MKNLALALVLTLSFGGVSVAETKPTKENSVSVARNLYNVLQLHEGQYIKIKSLEKVKVQEQKDAQAFLSGEALTAELTEISNRFEAGVQAVLTPAQLEAFQAYKNK